MAKPLPFYKDPDFLRPQTWLLLGALVCNLLTYILPVSGFGMVGFEGKIFPNRVAQLMMGVDLGQPAAEFGSQVSTLFYLSLLILGGLLLSLLFYRKRSLQYKVVLVVAVAFLTAVFAGYTQAGRSIDRNLPGGEVYLSWGSAFLLLGSVLCLLAIRRIWSDIKKLKKSDRFW